MSRLVFFILFLSTNFVFANDSFKLEPMTLEGINYICRLPDTGGDSCIPTASYLFENSPSPNLIIDGTKMHRAEVRNLAISPAFEEDAEQKSFKEGTTYPIYFNLFVQPTDVIDTTLTTYVDADLTIDSVLDGVPILSLTNIEFADSGIGDSAARSIAIVLDSGFKNISEETEKIISEETAKPIADLLDTHYGWTPQ